MNITNDKHGAVFVYFCSFDDVLEDQRIGKEGLVFGKLKDVARHYGMSSFFIDGGICFVGDKSKTRMFIEKLHFSRTPYKIQRNIEKIKNILKKA